MKTTQKILWILFVVTFLGVLVLSIGIVLTPQKVPCVAEKELIRFSGYSARAPFTCPFDQYFSFMISFSESHVLTNFEGKLKIFDNTQLLMERKVGYLTKCNLLSRKDIQSVFALEFEPDDGYGNNWGSLLVANQTYFVEVESQEQLVDVTLYYTYIYFDYLR